MNQSSVHRNVTTKQDETNENWEQLSLSNSLSNIKIALLHCSKGRVNSTSSNKIVK